MEQTGKVAIGAAADDSHFSRVTFFGKARTKDEKIDWVGGVPFVGVHLAALMVFWAGWNWTAFGACLFFYAIRMFAITGGYHRYFSHRSYKTGRVFQFLLAFLGATSAQLGPLWWAAHHRHHHRHSDTEEDIHSPGLRGLWWAHVGWILCKKYNATRIDDIKDFAKFPELRWLDRYSVIAPIVLAVAIFYSGVALELWMPELGVTAFQMLVWGFFVSTVFLYHGTFSINSLAHIIGRRRFRTPDHSRNSFFLSIITLGEGWHNNHHRYPSAERQGMYWWEIDISHYVLKVLSFFGIVWDLRTHPERLYNEAEHGVPAPADA